MTRSNSTELPPYYYRDNFLRLCETVEAQYADLLSEEEHALLALWRALPLAAQCLYVRLVSRRGPWFRESALTYAEIGPTGPALDELLEAGLVSLAEGLEPEELGALLTRDELARAFGPDFEGARPGSKSELLEAVGALALDGAALLARARRVEPSRIVAPLHLETVARLQVLFFGNRHQSLTEFVLADLGVTQYFPYRLDRERRLFRERSELDEYLNCTALADCHAELLDAGQAERLPDLATLVLAQRPAGEAALRRWQRLCNSLARDLERAGEDDTAFALYEGSERHPARERRARILERRGDCAAARDLCAAILADPWCEAEREAAARILPRVARRLGAAPAPRRRDRFDEIALAVPRGPCVERQAAAALAPDWQAVHYVENRLINTLFGLALWEQLFAPVSGVFHHPFQSGPSDMYDRTFWNRRRTLIDARLEQLAGADLADELGAAWHRYHPCQCRWVDWRHVDADLVVAAARIVPREHLLAMFRRLLFDPRDNRSGLPDLIALGERAGNYRLIEVKGPGDTLHDGQRRWLRFFQQQGIPASVAKVSWRDA